LNTSLMFSSAKADWSTPEDFFQQLDAEFRFGLDAAATAQNCKLKAYLGPGSFLAEDGLTADWQKFAWGLAVYVNPPYGRGIGQWVQKAYEESQKGLTVVMLLPARTDVRWFHQWALKGELRFVEGRLKFGDGSNSAPFPSVVVVFRPPSVGPYKWAQK
jgi:phage N-6-adenine-methyltransferase